MSADIRDERVRGYIDQRISVRPRLQRRLTDGLVVEHVAFERL